MIIKILDDIFLTLENTKNFLLDNEIIAEIKQCNVCGSVAKLKILQRNVKSVLMYRCTTKNCQKRISITNFHLPLNKLLHLIFLLLADINYEQLYLFHGISDSTIARLKKKLDLIYCSILDEHPVLVGGLNCVVEIDETVLSRRGVVRNPTTFDEIRTDTVWILGCIDRSNENNFWLRRVSNRQVNTMVDALNGVISIGSILYSDGHPSYPRIASELALSHHIVNHSIGFVAADGTNTNTIEGFWSHLKATMRKENGVKRENIDTWINRYTFKRRYLMKKSREEFLDIFIKILKKYLN